MDLQRTIKFAGADVNILGTVVKAGSSDHKEMDFGQKYGCLMEQPRLLTRAVFVVDRQGIIQYAAYMNALGDEPDYEAVLHAAKAALNSGG